MTDRPGANPVSGGDGHAGGGGAGTGAASPAAAPRVICADDSQAPPGPGLESPILQSPAAMPVKNLRVTFWGVQGSCSIFPTQREVCEYSRQLAVQTLESALKALADRMDRGEWNGRSPADELRRLAGQPAVEHFLQQLGVPLLPIYGGDTTCVEVETGDGDVLVFDMGTGLREFSAHLLRRWSDRPREQRVLHVFGSHEHLDHRSGLSFAGLCFVKDRPFTLHVHGTRQFLRALDEHYGLFSHEIKPNAHFDDPIDYRIMTPTFTGTAFHTGCVPLTPAEDDTGPAPWRVHDVAEPVRIGRTAVQAFELYHADTEALGYRVSHGGASFVFCTDHELRHGPDASDPRQVRSLAAEARLVEQCRGADAAYFDGQYVLAEYRGQQGIGSSPAMSRMDWGHSCVEDVVERGRRCGVRRVFIGHHDPERPWQERLRIDRDLARVSEESGGQFRAELARPETVVDL